VNLFGRTWAMAALVVAVSSLTAVAQEQPKLVFNIDFNDMVVAKPVPGVPFVGSPNGHYPEEDLRGLIGRAAESGFSMINFRIAVCGRAACRSKVKEWPDHSPAWPETLKRYDPFAVAVDAAHRAGIECYAWITPLDDCGPGGGQEEPGKLQSRFSFEHPELQLLSPDGTDSLWGVYSFGHPKAREYFLRHIDELLAYGPDGIFFSNRTHSNMNLRQSEYGFNQPVIDRYKELYGGDPRDAAAYDLEKFSRVQGEFYTQFLRQAAERIHGVGKQSMVAVSWQRNGRIARRLGALDQNFFDWPTWCRQGIVDELAIGGDLATGNDPEHILPHYETSADSANPDYFRKQISGDVSVYRWLTIWSWGWNVEQDRIRGTFTAPVVGKMLDKARKPRLDGVLIHEALNIALADQWELYAKFTGKQ